MQPWILWILSPKINEGHMKVYRKLHFIHLKILGGDIFFFTCADKKQSNKTTKNRGEWCGLLFIDLIGIAELYIYDLTSDLHFLFSHSTRRYCTIQPNKSVKKNTIKSCSDLWTHSIQ